MADNVAACDSLPYPSRMSQRSMQTPDRAGPGALPDTGRRPTRFGALFAASVAILAALAVSATAIFSQAPRAEALADLKGLEAARATAALPLPSDTVLRVTFLDVGQGDAVLLQAPEGQTALVDAGRGDVVPLLREMGVEQIDLLVATHPHADHIGGMAGVIQSMPVRFYMDNGQPHTTATYRRLVAALEARPEITYLEAVPRTISLGSAEIEVLPLLPRGTADHNNRSVALVVRFGDFRALLSGDSEVRQLTHLVGQGLVPGLTLLKAPHHGSDNGFTWAFLEAARPEVVVVSVGRNSYGHPKPTALRAFASVGAAVLRTDLAGHVAILGRRDGAYSVARGEHVASGRGSGARRDQVGDAMRGVAGDAVTGVGATAPVSASASGRGLRLSVHADAPGNDNRNPNGEYAVLDNLRGDDLAIGGWTLCDDTNHCFRFPRGTVLAAGGRVVVHTGSGRSDGERFYMGRGRAVWNNDGDTASLTDAEGAMVLVFRY